MKHTFKVGDVVRRTGKYSHGAHVPGSIGTITHVDEIHLRFGGGEQYFWENYELVPPSAPAKSPKNPFINTKTVTDVGGTVEVGSFTIQVSGGVTFVGSRGQFVTPLRGTHLSDLIAALTAAQTAITSGDY